MNVRIVPAKTPGRESGNVTRRNAPQPLAYRSFGRLDELRVDLLERDVERQHHERQEVVGDAGDDGDRRVEQPELGRHEVQLLERPEDGSRVVEQDLPADRPDQEAREERRDDQEQQEALVAAAAEGDRVGDREADQERQQRRDPAVDQRVAPAASGTS